MVAIIPMHCQTLAQFSRLYVGHVRAGTLRLDKEFAGKNRRVVVHAVLPGGIEIDFPGEIADENGTPVVRFDPVPAEIPERVARLVSGE